MNTDPNIIWQILISALLFVSVAMVIYTLFGIRLASEPPINRRIALALGVGQRNTVFEAAGIRQFMLMCLMLARRFPLCRERIRQDLEAAGNPSGYTVEEYVAICLATGILMAGVGFFAAGLFGPLGVVVLIGTPLLGFYVPLWSLRDQAKRRTMEISKKLPYTLDLIALLMEAGATFTEAIETVIADAPDDQLNQELQLVRAEIDFGTTRAGALSNMAARIPLDSLRGVVGAINQSEALGTPLGIILKNQAGMLRHIRSVRAEELAAKASLKILVPSLLILAAVVLVVFSPIIVQLATGQGTLVP